MLDLEPGAKGLPDGLIEGLLYPDCETHIAYRGRRLAGRLVRGAEASVRVPLPETGAWRIVRGADGRLDGLQTVSVGRPRLGPGEIRVRVEAAGLNFRDVLVAMNLYPEPDATLGGEFCGQVLSVGPDVGTIDVGDRVMGFAASFADETVTRADLATRAPENYSPVALATMPIVFATADLAFNLAGLKAGERLLIHAAAGGVGLAAIQLARLLGVEVYATASASKQAYLRSLGVKHVFDSRRTTFGAEILEATGGAGVDVVLNSLTSPGFIEASLTCLARSGRFVEIGKRDIWTVQAMASARPDVAYHILAVNHLLQREPQRLGNRGTAEVWRDHPFAGDRLADERSTGRHRLHAGGPPRRQNRVDRATELARAAV
jgi:NADPH:quinone reductase-like Zn-dependent oxidoreductase